MPWGVEVGRQERKDSVAGKKVGHEKMLTSQISGKPLGRPSVGSWLRAGKNSRASHSKVKEGLFREIDTHSIDRVWAISKARDTRVWGCQFL